MKTYYVAPSDITFLWSDCPRCFYRKVAQGIPRPMGIFPKVFQHITQEMQSYYLDKNLRDFSPDFPEATLRYPGQWVKSKPLVVAGKDIQIVFRGRIDGILEYAGLGANGSPINGVRLMILSLKGLIHQRKRIGSGFCLLMDIILVKM